MFGKKAPEAMPPIQIKDVQHLDMELAGAEDGIASSPFTTGLSAQEIFLLARCGYEPYQVVVGTIVYSMGLRGVIRSFMRAFTRGEMAEFSHLQRVARDLAIARMRARAQEIGALGVVNVRIDAIQYADFLEVVAVGTAVAKVGTRVQIPIPDPSHAGPEVVVST